MPGQYVYLSRCIFIFGQAQQWKQNVRRNISLRNISSNMHFFQNVFFFFHDKIIY